VFFEKADANGAYNNPAPRDIFPLAGILFCGGHRDAPLRQFSHLLNFFLPCGLISRKRMEDVLH